MLTLRLAAAGGGRGCGRLGLAQRAAGLSLSWRRAASAGPRLAVASQEDGAKYKRSVYSVEAVSAAARAFRVDRVHEGALTSWPSEEPRARDADAQAPSSARQAARQAAQRAWNVLWDMFMPKDAHESVTRDYFPYAKWFFFSSVVSSAGGVLSMQSLLYAIGLGAGSIPTAAAVNWVLKDGVGQFGGVLFASMVNNRYDADPKRWRLASAAALDISVLVEILTPLCPAYFLPMASLANVAKNISWLSTSATRAGFHSSFALRENLADITAKAGSQAIASSIIGTGLGIAISQWTGASTAHVLGAFGVLSALNLLAVYRSLNCVWLRTLNCQRLHLVTAHYLASGQRELPSLQAVSAQEQFISVLFSGYKSLFNSSLIKSDASLSALSQSSPDELLRLREFYANERYLLNATRDGAQWRIDVALEEVATNQDALFAHLHGVILQKELETAPAGEASVSAWPAVEKAYQASLGIRSGFLDKLHESDWNAATLLVEERSSRYKWLTSRDGEPRQQL